jgi:hypothetical protein
MTVGFSIDLIKAAALYSCDLPSLDQLVQV